MKVVINADDFGYSEGITRAILAAWRQGIVTATTAMTNMPFFEQAMELARAGSRIHSVGLHFNLTEGIPLTEEMRSCRTLCDDTGCFTGAWHRQTSSRFSLPKSASRAIATEAKAQIERYLDCGGVLMHLDSHHHVHTDFSVARVLFPIARAYGFKSVRLSKTIGTRVGFVKRVYKKLYNGWVRGGIGANADEFTDFNGFARAYPQISGKTVVEVMVHPQFARKGTSGEEDVLADLGRVMSGDLMFWRGLERQNLVRRVDYAEGILH